MLIGGTALPYYRVEYDCHQPLLATTVSCTLVLTLLLAGLVGTQTWFEQSRFVRALAFTAFAGTCAGFGGASTFVDFNVRRELQLEPHSQRGRPPTHSEGVTAHSIASVRNDRRE